MRGWKLLCLFACAAIAGDARAFFIAGKSAVAPAGGLLLDTVPCLSSSDAAFGTVKLRTAYNGNAFILRVRHSGVYVTQNIGFVGNVADYAAADTYAATSDAGVPADLRFYDQCGNGNTLSFSAAVTQKGALWSPYTLGTTTLRTGSFDLANDNSTIGRREILNMPTTMSFNMDASSVVYIGRRGTVYPAHNNSYFEFANTAPWYDGWYDWDTDGGSNVLLSSGAKLNFGTTETTPGVYSVIADSTTLTFSANEVSTTLSKSTLSATSVGGTIGNSAHLDGRYDGSFDMVAEVFYNRVLTPTEQAAVKSYGYGVIGNPPTIPTCIVTIGDSLSQGYPAQYNSNYISQAVSGVATPISKPVRIYQAPTNGATAAQMLSHVSRYTGACSNAGVTTKVAFIMAGTNDLNGGATPATTAGKIWSIATAMHNAGFSVVCATIPNNNEGTNVAGYNALISSGWATNNCDALADIWSDPHIGAGSNTADTTYFFSDGVHLSVTGYGIVGQFFATQVNTLI